MAKDPVPVKGDLELKGSNLGISDGEYTLKVNPDGSINVAGSTKGSNAPLASGAITPATPLEINATTDHRGILIATSGDTGVELGFEHFVDGLGWLPWKDGLGEPVIAYLDENAVYGPFQGFPLFDRGRLTLIAGNDMSSNVAKDKTYATNSELDDDSSPALAFDEDINTYYASEITFNKNIWVSVDLGAPQAISILQMWGRDGSGTIQNFRFEGTNHSIDAPDAEWDVLVTDVLQRNGEDQSWDISAPAYRYYRIFAIDGYGAGNISIYDVRLFSSPTVNVVVQGVL